MYVLNTYLTYTTQYTALVAQWHGQYDTDLSG